MCAGNIFVKNPGGPPIHHFKNCSSDNWNSSTNQIGLPFTEITRAVIGSMVDNKF